MRAEEGFTLRSYAVVSTNAVACRMKITCDAVKQRKESRKH